MREKLVPAKLFPACDFILEEAEYCGMPLLELTRCLGKHACVLDPTNRMTEAQAKQLKMIFDVRPRLWLALDAGYWAWKERLDTPTTPETEDERGT